MEEELGGNFVIAVEELGVTGLWTTIKDVSISSQCWHAIDRLHPMLTPPDSSSMPHWVRVCRVHVGVC